MFFEEDMSKTKKERIKDHYLKERARIIAAMNSELRDQAVDMDGDDIDHIQGMAISQLADRLGMRDLVRLRRIDAALTKIDQKDFGKCEYCGKQIGDRRLMALPGVETCVKCAEEVEREAQQFAIA
jgi:RNA polymerase-binding transcription factor DksA